MPNLIEPPVKPGRRRPSSFEDDTDKRSLKVGLILTLIVWPALIFILGFALAQLGHGGGGPSEPATQNFSIELTPELNTQEPQPTPPPDRFVETNPDAPENTPDKTRNFAARNQQVAQEKPDLENSSEAPQLAGKKEEEVTQIVDGRLKDPEQPPPAPMPIPALPPAPQTVQAQREQNPLPGTEKIEGDNAEGFGTNVAETAENALNIPQKVDGQKDGPDVHSPGAPGQPRIDPQRPQPRQRIEQNVRPAILAQNKIGTSNIGLTAIDARWSQYGEYLQKLIESVQVQWERILIHSSVRPPQGTTVKVRFRLEATEGAISEILEWDSTGGSQAGRACISAITERAPYGKWTDDMVAMLGQSQDLTFTFHYQ